MARLFQIFNRVRNGHGSVQEITDEREFFEAAKSSRRLVALFYRTGSAVCDSMVQHTRRLAESHMETKFLTIDVAKTPFLVDRLDIFVLPTMVTIEEGSTKNKFKGYDAFGGTANIHTGVIERVLKSVGALDKTPIAEGSGAQDEQMEETGNDSDLDWE
ncbi:hypothetical protein SARC_00925 [Sphaeroforma arctica JP610]|uniref:Thioredoxin domain-containing protein n=1 Tax=Sphaeroforma arctica JP610 TaxID=667725 RepID=A0A0L0GD90_9EUKA|nr:hypothetical protein SARC_00925 [Sphaeroforma arctica JP610]KNC86975.1 hypothetical protein SARC_00925 [Sphaeroforma arctica JP610]|eukprot:XP_014160877.1 hypothetical protein SARC_00925 [Sphaeroforma arctica JP610]